MSRHALLVLAVVVLASGCYAPQIGDGDLLCTDGGVCPRGFRCGLDRRCWRNPDARPSPQADAEAGAETGAETADRTETADRPSGVDAAEPDRPADADAPAAERPPVLDAQDAPADAPADLGRDAAKKPLGATCRDPSECGSTFCADGVCCQEACTGSCQACNVVGSAAGVCTAVAAGAASPPGHPACAQTALASCQTDGKCDGRGACRRYAAADGACAGARCDVGTGTILLESRCNGQGTCVPGSATSCAPFRCRGDGTACLSSCTSSADCMAGAVCNSGSCGSKPRGSPCTAGTECTSGRCIDRVCCDTDCAGQCEACDLASAPGTCSPVTSGPPRGDRASCGGAGACAGACAPGLRATCTFPGAGVVCRSQSCAGSTLTPAASCDGMGACSPAATRPCAGGLACNDAGTTCLTACRGDGDCVSAAAPYCQAPACTAARPNGLGCGTGADCQSQTCVDARCCNLPCGGQCEACDVAGHAGTCWPIPAREAPHAARGSCGGTAACAGFCNGASNQCTFPGPETQCACPLLPLGGTCNRAGQCMMLGNLCL